MKEGATLTMHVYKKKTDRKRKILIVSADFVTTELIYAKIQEVVIDHRDMIY